MQYVDPSLVSSVLIKGVVLVATSRVAEHSRNAAKIVNMALCSNDRK